MVGGAAFRDLGPGDMFGEYAAIDGKPRSATVEARNALHVASMPAADSGRYLRRQPNVSEALLKTLLLKYVNLRRGYYGSFTLNIEDAHPS